MADKQAILAKAKAWFVGQRLDAECPRDGCNAVNKWTIGEVSKVNRAEYDREIGGTRGIKDPELYLVQMTCGWCGQIGLTYQEEVPLDLPVI